MPGYPTARKEKPMNANQKTAEEIIRATDRIVPDKEPSGSDRRLVRPGVAYFKCNACGAVVRRQLGWKTWHPSFCKATGKNARLYRISAPV